MRMVEACSHKSAAYIRDAGDTMSDQTPEAKVRRSLRRINDAWLNGRVDEAADCFDDGMIMVHPGFQGRTVGKDACLQSYKDFRAAATVHAYHEDEVKVDVWDALAIASYRFQMDYEVRGERFVEGGVDLYAFVRQRLG